MNVNFDNISKNIKENKYGYIGSGSGRLVYDLNNGYVVKKAKNKKGLMQNKTEYNIASTNHSRILARITAVSDDFNYLIMEKADKLKSISEVWKYYDVANFKELFALEEFKSLSNKNDLLVVDLRRLTSWGLVKGKPVIIDFGFTKEVSRLYNPFRI